MENASTSITPGGDVDDVGGREEDATTNDISIETASNYHLGDIDVGDDSFDGRGEEDVSMVRAGSTTTPDYDDDDDDSHDSYDGPPSSAWEDFMVEYFRHPSASQDHGEGSAMTSSSAAALLRAEDTDLRPIEMEPELDDEHGGDDADDAGGLSRVRTGCIDMDMDVSLIVVDDDVLDGGGGGELARLCVAGRECSRAMANIALSGGGTGDPQVLRIDLGTTMDTRRRVVRGDDPVGIVSSTAADVVDVGNRPTSLIAASATTVYVEDDDGDDDDDDDDHRDGGKGDGKSTASSAVESTSSVGGRSSLTGNNSGNAVVGAAPITDWNKVKASPLPLPDMVLLTGPILTRTSLRSLVMKKWNPSYWMQYGTHTLFVFRSKEHMVS
jgi:hypothetical protein